MLSLWYSNSMLNALFLISKMRKGNKERKKSLILAGKIKKEKKNERNENENYYLLNGDWTRSGTFLIIVSVSWTDNFMNVSNSVTSPRVISYCCVLHYFLTMPVCFNFNLTYGLKRHVSGIKIVTVYRQSIFQVEWLIATLIIKIQWF